jgi:nitrite reductase/ring-hydroxylating ferredoxin subunit
MTHREDDKEKPEKKYKLFNIKTGEVLVLDATTEQLNYIMVELLKGKYFVQEKKNDREFIEDCMEKML